MLMRNSNTGQFEVYDISNNAITSAAPMGQVGLEWPVAGFGDFSTRPNETDMLMRNSNTGQFEVYDISNNQITSAAPMGQVGLEWSVAGFGDFSGNANETDMLMRNNNTGAFEIYDIRNNQIVSARADGASRIGVASRWLRPDQWRRRERHADAQQSILAHSRSTTSPTTASHRRRPWVRSGLEWSVAGIAADPPGTAPANCAARAGDGVVRHCPQRQPARLFPSSEPLNNRSRRS